MDILSNAPWWAYLGFMISVAIGIASTRPRTISFHRLVILPALFTLLNIAWLAERLQGRYSLLSFWICTLAIGSYLGWQTVRNWETEADHQKKRLSLPGSWSTLYLILAVFATRYFFTYNYELHPEAYIHLFLADAIVSGLITGIFIGRSVELYRKYQKG